MRYAPKERESGDHYILTLQLIRRRSTLHSRSTSNGTDRQYYPELEQLTTFNTSRDSFRRGSRSRQE